MEVERDGGMNGMLPALCPSELRGGRANNPGNMLGWGKARRACEGQGQTSVPLPPSPIQSQSKGSNPSGPRGNGGMGLPLSHTDGLPLPRRGPNE